MNRVLFLSLLLAGLPLFSSGAERGAEPSRPAGVAAPSRYTQAMFVEALENRSTAPDYVLFTVVDGRSGKSREVCVETPSLEGALHTELAVSYEEAPKAALPRTDHVFRFAKKAALRDVRAAYTAEQLDAARARIAGKSDAELLNHEVVQSLYQWNDGSREAAAHALLERGLGCTRGCRAGFLTTYQSARP